MALEPFQEFIESAAVGTTPLMLNHLLEKAGCDLASVRIMRHTDDNALPGRTIYELWRDNRAEFERYQAQQDPRTHKIVKKSSKWCSFVATPQGETMFVGLYDVRYTGLNETDLEVPTSGKIHLPGSQHVYETTKNSALTEYEGRLFIMWGAHRSAYRAWCQHALRNDKPIVEIKKRFSEPEFPGYLNFIGIITQIPALPLPWVEALKSAVGVYVLTCPKTKELYVGSATGIDGFYGRWCEYARDGHGGNIRLRNRDRTEYQVSILEVCGTAMTTQDIQIRESHWKNKLQSREMGLNSN
jgi:hypothetical protein